MRSQRASSSCEWVLRLPEVLLPGGPRRSQQRRVPRTCGTSQRASSSIWCRLGTGGPSARARTRQSTWSTISSAPPWGWVAFSSTFSSGHSDHLRELLREPTHHPTHQHHGRSHLESVPLVVVIATIYESCWSTGAAGLPLVVVIATIYESQFRTTPQPPPHPRDTYC